MMSERMNFDCLCKRVVCETVELLSEEVAAGCLFVRADSALAGALKTAQAEGSQLRKAGAAHFRHQARLDAPTGRQGAPRNRQVS